MKNRRLAELAGLIHRSTVEEKVPLNESRLLLEEEDEGGGEVDIFGDEGGDDAAGEDDAGGDEGGDLFGDEGGDEAEGEGGDEEGGEEEDKEKPEDVEVEELSAKDIANFGTGEIDSELDQVFVGIFDRAMQRADVRSKTSIGYPGRQDMSDLEESLNQYNMRALLKEEQDTDDTPAAADFDMAYFADEINRYIQNYDTLLDIEGMIFNKARQFLLNQFNSETAAEFEDFMARVHGFDPQQKFENPSEPGGALTSPVAVGASAAASGA